MAAWRNLFSRHHAPGEGNTGGSPNLDPNRRFVRALDDAEVMLRYAAESGVEVDPQTREMVLRARSIRHTPSEQWDQQVLADLLTALTALSHALQPVSARSLREYYRVREGARVVHYYVKVTLLLAVIIVPVSVATFVTSALTNAMQADITKANELAVKLRTELGPPQASDIGMRDVITDLQTYGSTVRSLFARANELNHFILPRVDVPEPLKDVPDNASQQVKDARAAELKAKFELAVPVPDTVKARDDMTETYQDVRFFAMRIISDVSIFYGAIATCILPVLYALLGTCAFLLRNFEEKLNTRTYVPSSADSARFIVAAIGGAVVGLFNNFTITDKASIPPLGIAFLVGYAVDVFFELLNGIIKSFNRNVPAASSATAVAAQQAKPQP